MVLGAAGFEGNLSLLPGCRMSGGYCSCERRLLQVIAAAESLVVAHTVRGMTDLRQDGLSSANKLTTATIPASLRIASQRQADCRWIGK